MDIGEFLDELKQKHPNFEALNNLLVLLSYDGYTPDALVDLAHSLNEGVAKNLRFLIDRGTPRDKIEGQSNTAKQWNVVRDRLVSKNIPRDFLGKLHELFEDIRNLRNRQGDITHGHVGSKKYISEHEARFLLDLSLAHARYALACAQEVKPDNIPYDENPEFNDFLDEAGERIGSATYSRLIYDNDYDRYEGELEAFDPDIYAKDDAS